MLEWKCVTAEEKLRDNVEDIKEEFDVWFNEYWSHRTTREEMLSPNSPVLHVYHKMCLPFDQVKEMYLHKSLKECSDCGEKCERWIETNFSFCNEYGCGLTLCEKCAKKLRDCIDMFLTGYKEEEP
jgi:hypothetical protein